MSTKITLLWKLWALAAAAAAVEAGPASAFSPSRIPEPFPYSAKAACCHLLTNGHPLAIAQTIPLPSAVYRLHFTVTAKFDRQAVVVCRAGRLRATATGGHGTRTINGDGYLTVRSYGIALSIQCRLAGRATHATILAAAVAARPVAPVRAIDPVPQAPPADGVENEIGR